MPTSLFSEMDRGTNGGGAGVSFEDQRALQLAFELSMLGIPEGSSGCPGTGTGNGTTNDPDPLQTAPAVFEEARSKKSQNMTECVPVPSSEHVAEIVGRQGSSCAYTRLISRRGLKFVFSPQAPALLVVMMVVVVVVDAFVGLRSSCRPTPGLSVLMLETRSTLDPREQARKIEKERNAVGTRVCGTCCMAATLKGEERKEEKERMTRRWTDGRTDERVVTTPARVLHYASGHFIHALQLE
ncbi:RNA-binding protein MEX3B [Cyphomyrmex costatus]|uniref:RNA-binding protein MEX3B n=1 Tax=Cyphomyrmex costatus TaxID=456900 RepID=A0A195CQX5_9HYME|nr:RNA-binding protein MEX3B [Cyphomyrmex costatus]